MNLDRRSVLKNLLVVTGGVIFLPSCLHKNDATTSIQLKNLALTGNDEHLLAELSETIIPKTDTPGAKDTYTHLYILKTIDDCRTKEDQKKFEKGLKAFDKFVQKSNQKSFMELTPTQRGGVLLQMERKKDVPEDVQAFYKTIKGLTIQGYMSSKFYLTKVQVYELTPGRFKGCIQLPQPLKGNKQHV
jgi:gluconate 2-dehydrogenase subunit 3-like protein